MPLWSAFGSRFERVVALKGGDLDTRSRLLSAGVDEIAQLDSGFRFSTGLSELAEALSHAGRIAEASALVEAGSSNPMGVGSRRICCALRANFCYCKVRLQSRKRRRTSFGRR